MQEKGYLPEQVFNTNRFLIQIEVSYSGGATKDSISKEEKLAPEFKAGRNKLTPLCICSWVFLIRPALTYKANSQTLKGKNKHQLPVFWYKMWTVGTLFLDWFHQLFCL